MRENWEVAAGVASAAIALVSFILAAVAARRTRSSNIETAKISKDALSAAENANRINREALERSETSSRMSLNQAARSEERERLVDAYINLIAATSKAAASIREQSKTILFDRGEASMRHEKEAYDAFEAFERARIKHDVCRVQERNFESWVLDVGQSILWTLIDMEHLYRTRQPYAEAVIESISSDLGGPPSDAPAWLLDLGSWWAKNSRIKSGVFANDAGWDSAVGRLAEDFARDYIQGMARFALHGSIPQT